ncbi:MAG: phosphate/phosphite/phosphonate ABC transporter substrate-binding protein [Arcobacteraceae bacterium]|nr:phosphate/phosphite/phosphonate ABC transporter substrate-binding protein [Arcobacteraceae bacterium]
MKFNKVVGLILLYTSCVLADGIKIGVLPYADALKILNIHQPLKDFLSSELNQEVQIYTSASYEKFFEDTAKGQFDIIITGPHFGLLHIQDGFVPLVRYNTNLKPIFVVLKNSGYSKISDLKNKKISMSNYLSVSSIAGIKSLIDESFVNGIDFTLMNYKSHTSAIMSVVLHESDAAITTHTPIQQLTDENIKSQIRIIESDFAMPHLFTIANPSLGSNKIVLIKKALIDFQSSPKGLEFFQKTGYKSYIDISQKDFDSIQPVLEETKGFLGLK